MMEDKFQPGDKAIITAWCKHDLNYPEYMELNYPLGSVVTITGYNVLGNYNVDNNAGWWSFPPECLEPAYCQGEYVILTEYHADDYHDEIVDDVPISAILTITSEVIIGGTAGLPYYRCSYNDAVVSLYAYQLVPLKKSP